MFAHPYTTSSPRRTRKWCLLNFQQTSLQIFQSVWYEINEHGLKLTSLTFWPWKLKNSATRWYWLLLLSSPTQVWHEMSIILFNLPETDLYAKYISWWNEFFWLSMGSEIATNEMHTDQHIAQMAIWQYISETSICSCGKLKVNSAF